MPVFMSLISQLDAFGKLMHVTSYTVKPAAYDSRGSNN